MTTTMSLIIIFVCLSHSLTQLYSIARALWNNQLKKSLLQGQKYLSFFFSEIYCLSKQTFSTIFADSEIFGCKINATRTLSKHIQEATCAGDEARY